ncbi:hypothetical protein ACFLTH_12770 [Bacteroidota bacterium]
MKRFSLVLFLIAFSTIFSAFVSAQEGCCCIGSQAEITIESYCTISEGRFYDGIFNLDKCRYECLDECVWKKCEYAVTTDCLCGEENASAGQFCCANSQLVEDTQLLCKRDGFACADIITETHTVSGVVNDRDGNLLEDVTVTVQNIHDKTDEFGHYLLEGVPGNTYLTITAEGPYCIPESKNIEIYEDYTQDFQIDCTTATESCQDNGGICCAPHYWCGGDESIGITDCDSGYSCYTGCSECVLYEPDPDEKCETGSCLTPNNYYCNSSQEWQNFGSDLDAYCEKCGEIDADCLERPCVTDGACDGVCPLNCGPEDDYDCGGTNACVISSNRWCDTYGFEGTVGWKDYGIPMSESDKDKYCSHCGSLDITDCNTCGDGVWDQNNEQCDLSDPTSPTNCNPTLCTFLTGNKCGNGVWDSATEQCDPGINNGQTNDWNDLCNPIIYNGCSEDCTCTHICSATMDPPGDVEANQKYFSKEVTVTWTPPDNCQIINNVIIRKCEGDRCNPNVILREGIDSSETFYTDTEEKIYGETYGYEVEIVYAENTEDKKSDIDYVTIRDEECTEPNENSFCMLGDDYLHFCEDGVVVQEEGNECTGFCSELRGTAFCVGEASCEDCNSVYGVFANFMLNNNYENLRIDYNDRGETISAYCSELITSEKPVCYIEKNSKSVPKLEECSEVSNCYDFKSSDSCKDDNPCGKLHDINGNFNCEWNYYPFEDTAGAELSSPEFNLGVCTPIKQTQQNCELCNSNNNSIFPVCDSNICSLYGDCYFSDKDGSCSGINDFSCSDYTNEEDCIGKSKDGSNFAMNETNVVISSSKDYFNFSKCKWDPNYGEGKCYKDSDDNQPTYSTSPPEKDCSSEDQQCMSDFESPKTIIDHTIYNSDYISGKIFSMEFTALDNNYSIDELDTFYCFASSTESDKCIHAKSDFYKYIKPPHTTHNYSVVDSDKMIEYEFSEVEESYTLYYFTADPARNLETVNTYTFSVDGIAPVCGLSSAPTYSSEEIPEGSDDWESYLTADFECNEPATCDIILMNAHEEKKGYDIKNVHGRIFHNEYADLADGHYKFVLDCTDDAGNEGNSDYEFFIEGDKSISDLSVSSDGINWFPSKKRFYKDFTDKATIHISIKTMYNATCRYSGGDPIFGNPFYNNMVKNNNYVEHKYQQSFETTTKTPEGYIHKATIPVSSSGVYRLFTACNISVNETGVVEHKITENNDADWIIFSVDDLAPTTFVYNKNTGVQIDNSVEKWYNNLKVEFVCSETDYVETSYGTFGMTLGNFWDGSFGCKNMFFEGKSWIGNTKYEEKLDTNGNYTFFYKSVDNADEVGNAYNLEDLKNITIHIDTNTAHLSLNISKNGATVPDTESLNYGTYDFNITSTKKIAKVIRFSYIVSNSESASDNIAVADFDLSENKNNIHAKINFKNHDEFKNKEGKIDLVVEIEDEHGFSSTEDFELSYITTGPNDPRPTPIFNIGSLDSLSSVSGKVYKDKNGQLYPFIYYEEEITIGNGETREKIYVVRDKNIYITGYTDDVGIVEFYRIKTWVDEFNPIVTYNQVLENGVVKESDTETIKTAEKGKNNFTIVMTPINSPHYNWNSGKYLGFSELSYESGLTSYGNYGKFYGISGYNIESSDEQIIFIDSNLEKTVASGDKVYLYEKDYYHNWFGKELPLIYSSAGDNDYEIRVGLKNDIDTGLTERFNVFIDTVSPKTSIAKPRGGVFNGKDPIVIGFTEHVGGSGIKTDSLSLTYTKDGITTTSVSTKNGLLNFTELGEFNNGGQNEYLISYMPGTEWPDGLYSLKVHVEDQAGNLINTSGYFSDDGTIEFEVDKNYPGQPLFSVNGITPENIDTQNRSVTSNSKPTFKLDFTQKWNGNIEMLNVTIPNATIVDSNEIITCIGSGVFNIFNCSFDAEVSEGIYELEVKARKILFNGELGPEPSSSYIEDREGKPLTIIFDQTAPNFTLGTENGGCCVRNGTILTLVATLLNTEYDLTAEVVYLSERVELSTESKDNNYSFMVPGNSSVFDFGTEGYKDLSVIMKDFAGHETKESITIFYDTSVPTVTIDSIIGDKWFLRHNPANATVGKRNVTIIGTISSDVDILCYNQDEIEKGCITSCEEGGMEGCIEEVVGTRSNYTMALVINGVNSIEVWENVTLTITDRAGHDTTVPFYILIDLAPPAEPNIVYKKEE